MKVLMMLLRLILCSSIFLLTSNNSYANKLSLGIGGYSVDANVGNEATNITNIGAYKIQYHSKIEEQFELILGYTVLIEQIYKGDKSFGPFIGFSYYPFGSNTVSHSKVSNISILNIKQLNPYIYTGFSQRQYQSVKATYSGFSFGGGAELGLNKAISLFSDFQYGLLEGPNAGEATEITAVAGIMYNY